jgi:hypothetical protein
MDIQCGHGRHEHNNGDDYPEAEAQALTDTQISEVHGGLLLDMELVDGCIVVQIC